MIPQAPLLRPPLQWARDGLTVFGGSLCARDRALGLPRANLRGLQAPRAVVAGLLPFLFLLRLVMTPFASSSLLDRRHPCRLLLR